MYRGSVANFMPISKGLFDTLNNIDSDPQFTPDTRNSRFFPNYVRKRNGSSLIGGLVEAATRFTGGFQYRNPSNALRDCVTMRSSKFYVNSSGTWTNRTGAITLSNAADNRCHFTGFNGSVIGTDNVNTPFSWDGNVANNAAVLGGSPPTRALVGGVLGQRLIFANITDSGATAYPDAIVWSGINVTTGWATTGAGILRIQNAGGNPIYGLGYRDDRLVVLFETMVHEIIQTGAGSAPFEVLPLVSGTGTRAPYAVVSAYNDVFFLAEYGPERLSAVLDGRQGELAERIRSFWATVDYTDSMTFSGAYSHSERAIKWGVRTSTNTENDSTIVYRLDTDSFSIDTGYVADVMWSYTNSSGVRKSAAGSSAYTIELDAGNTDISVSDGTTTTGVNWYIWTNWLDMMNAERPSGPMRRKLWQELQLQFLQQTGNTMAVGYQLALFADTRTSSNIVMLNYNNAGLWDEAVWDASIWGGANEDQAQARVPLEGDSSHIRFKFSNSASVPVTLEGFSVAFRDTTGL